MKRRKPLQLARSGAAQLKELSFCSAVVTVKGARLCVCVGVRPYGNREGFEERFGLLTVSRITYAALPSGNGEWRGCFTAFSSTPWGEKVHECENGGKGRRV
jgi:hypothetical protein